MASHGGRNSRAAATIAAAMAMGCGLSVVGQDVSVADPEDAALRDSASGSTADAQRSDGEPDASPDAELDAPPPAVNAYVNTTTELHRVDGTSGVSTFVFTFGGSCAGIAVGDIAIDRSGAMFAVTLPPNSAPSNLYRVDRTTGACGPSLAALGMRCAGLTSAPAPSDTSKDILYAACDTSLFRIDPSAVQVQATSVGAFGTGLSVSGDIVWLPAHGLFATLTTGVGNDRVSRIDPDTGAATTVAADAGTAKLLGLAYDGAVLIAFGDKAAQTVDPVSGATAPLASQLSAYGAATGF